MNVFEEIEHKRQLFEKYGTTNPDNEFINVWNEEKYSYELFNVREFVDSVNERIKEVKMGEIRKLNPMIKVRTR